MAELTDAQIDAALERGKAASSHEPRAASVRYDGAFGRVVVELTNGRTFAFPVRLAQGLEGAAEEQLAQAEILSRLSWLGPRMPAQGSLKTHHFICCA